MDDRLLVEALRERDPGALAAVYDAHAHRLYAYCWFQLRHRDAVQVALRDTFITADAHIGKLRDPERFTPWLYAIARLECARRLPSADQLPDVPVARHDQEDVDRRIIAWQAVLALRPDYREALELRVRHRISLPDLAAVFDISLTDAKFMLDDAHRALTAAVTAEVLAHQGPYGCAERAALLRDRHSARSNELNGRLQEHAEECSVCDAFRPRKVSAAKVYGLLPDVDPPQELRLRVMSCFLDPELVGYRLFVARRVTQFTASGFPAQTLQAKAHPGGLSLLRRLRNTLSLSEESRPEAQVARAVLVLTAVAVMSGGGIASVHGFLGAGRRDGDTVTGPRPTVVPGVSQRPPSGRHGVDHPEHVSHVHAAPVSATFPLGAKVSTAPPTAQAAPPPALVSANVPRTEGKGTLSVSPLFLDLAGGSDGSIDLRAEGGPLAWQAKAGGQVTIQPSSGHLAAGQSVTVRVHVARQADAGGSGAITFTPGGSRVHVTWRPDTPDPGPGPDPMPTRSIPSDPSTPPVPGSPSPSSPPSSAAGPTSPSRPPSKPPSSGPSPSGPPPSGDEPAPPPPPDQPSTDPPPDPPPTETSPASGV